MPRLSDARDREQMEATLRRVMPPGTEATEAQAILRKDGFGGAIVRDEMIPDLGLDGPVIPQQGDYIYGERVWSYFPLFERRQRVIIILKDGVVDSYRTYYSLSGF